MRFANLDGRLTLVHGAPDGSLDGAPGTDVHAASGGAIPADPALALAMWDEVVAWSHTPSQASAVTIPRERLRAPSPRPAQIFGIGVNYADHGAEAAMEIPEVPLVFPKLTTAVAGLTVGQDLSDREIQWRPKSTPQFSLGKSLAGFAPLGLSQRDPTCSPAT